MRSMHDASGATGSAFSAKDLAACESRFAAYSVAHDMRAAFLEFFADDAVLLRPEMVQAKPWLSSRPAPAIVLDWKTQLAILSASRDIGLSTGPWMAISKQDPKAPADHGQFFSIWKRQPNGEWKVLLDHGISHAGPALSGETLDARDLPAAAGNPVSDVIDPEQGFIARSQIAGAATAYGEALAPRVRLLRSDRAPLDGANAVRDYLKTIDGQWSWNTLKQGTSAARDFVYVLGRYTRHRKDGVAESGHYIRVWTKDHAGQGTRWMLAAEVLTPLPPAK
jgi:ketosteroid isomerase-like protein